MKRLYEIFVLKGRTRVGFMRWRGPVEQSLEEAGAEIMESVILYGRALPEGWDGIAVYGRGERIIVPREPTGPDAG